jgi:hypothetical protein
LEELDRKVSDLKEVNREAVYLDMVDGVAWTMEAEIVFFCSVVVVGNLRNEYNTVYSELKDWLGAQGSRLWDDPVRSIWSSQ